MVAGPLSYRDAWRLDPDVVYLNHGSFGATPGVILDKQQALRDEIERQPVRFFARDIVDRLPEAIARTAQFVGASPDSFAFVDNATTGVNTVLRSLTFAPGDELLVTNLEYNASRNALDFVAERSGATVVVVEIDLPIASPAEVVDAIVAGVTERTRLLLVDHITSQTGLVLPIEAIVEAMNERGVETLVDGAHGPGMVPLDLSSLGATYYTGNFHKWACAPKAAAFLVVAPERRADIRPLAISHGANRGSADERFELEFGWTGTHDPTALFMVPEVIDYLGGLVEGGWPAIYERNRRLALEARALVNETLGERALCPDEMIGSLAAIRLPDGRGAAEPPYYIDPLQDALLDDFGIEVPIIAWPAAPRRLLRLSAHLYNERSDYERLADALSQAGSA